MMSAWIYTYKLIYIYEVLKKLSYRGVAETTLPGCLPGNPTFPSGNLPGLGVFWNCYCFFTFSSLSDRKKTEQTGALTGAITRREGLARRVVTLAYFSTWLDQANKQVCFCVWGGIPPHGPQQVHLDAPPPSLDPQLEKSTNVYICV